VRGEDRGVKRWREDAKKDGYERIRTEKWREDGEKDRNDRRRLEKRREDLKIYGKV